MIKKNLFVIFWATTATILLLFSLVFRNTETAIVAQVEPVKKAVSYHKAVKIIEIYVIAGQTVKPGDVLVKVERPDLMLDVEKKNSEIERLELNRTLTVSKFESKKQELLVEKDSKLRKIIGDIDQLNIVVTNSKQLSNQFGNLTGYTDTLGKQGASYYDIQLDGLIKEKEYIQKQYDLEMHSVSQLFVEEIKGYVIIEGQLKKELEALLIEERQLIKTAEIDGTIGSIFVQDGELLSPYTTILSIYESNPSIIKAVMNEGYKYEIEVGKMVQVESTNRRYSIEGKITEVGARIIEYPSRLKTNQNIPMWGQELFIKIPEDNKFLNGERVFVIIDN